MMSDDKPDSGSGDGQEADGANTEATKKSAWSEGAADAERAALQDENAALKDKLLRTMAEMENLRRRTEREKSDTAKYAISQFARDVLTVSDNMRRAIEAVPDEAVADDAPLKSLLDGVEVTERELTNALERHGIKRLEPKGERFDPHLHQAMFEIDRPDVVAGTVLDVLQAGYMIDDRVLRPALVSVAKGGEKPPAEPKSTARQTADSGTAANNNEPADGSPATEKPEGVGPDDAGPGSRVGGRVDKSA